MNETTLGQLISEEAVLFAAPQRDAIHIAVAPVMAGEDLMPGQHIGFVMGTNSIVGSKAEKLIGVVDPFLKEPVKEKQRFYMVLYPKTITSLRHHWTHPAFNEDDHWPFVAVTGSEDWLREFAIRWNMDYNEMIEGAIEGTYVTARGTGLHSKEELGEDYARFWHHMEAVTGKQFSIEHKENMAFSCSC